MTPEEELSLQKGRFTYETAQAEARAAADRGGAEPAGEEPEAPAEDPPAPGFPKGKKAGG